MPIIVNEDFSEEIACLLVQDDDIVVWWDSRVECMAALSRRFREGKLDQAFFDRSRDRFYLLFDAAFEIEPTPELRLLAENLSLDTSLKEADLLQLAAAMTWGDGEPEMEFVCLDRILREAAEMRDFATLPKSGAT